MAALLVMTKSVEKFSFFGSWLKATFSTWSQTFLNIPCQTLSSAKTEKVGVGMNNC